MTDLTPVELLSPVVQLETTDRALAGTGNPMNRQAQALLNRDAYRAAQIASLGASAATFQADLADEIDPAKGAALVGRSSVTIDSIADLLLANRSETARYLVKGYNAGTNYGGGEFYWDAASTETENTITIFQVPGVPTGRFKRIYEDFVLATWSGAVGDGVTDDTVALQNLHNQQEFKKIIYPARTFLISSAIEVINNGQSIYGVGGQRFSLPPARINQATASTQVFKQTASDGVGQEDAFSVYDMWLNSDQGIQLNPLDEAVVDGGGATFPYLMRPEFRRLTLTPLTPGLAGNFGIAMAKTFDHIIEQCDINGQTRGVAMNGCDLGRVSTNRITNFHEYGILDLSASTFGSQNLITNNDIVNAAAATATFIRSTARHVRIIDNYLEEASGGAKGFIDLSWQSGLDYPNNTSSGMFGTVEVERNRLDGHSLVTDFIYRFDPTTTPSFGYSVNIEDVGTNGTSSTLPWLTVTGATLPIRVGSQGYKKYRLKGGYNTSNVNRFTSFETQPPNVSAGKVSITSENLVNMMRSELNRNNAADHVGLSDAGFVIKTTLGTSLLHVVLPAVGGVNNPWLRNAASIPVTIVARCVAGTQNLNALKVVDAAAQGVTVSTSLDTQWQTINMTFTGVVDTSTVGIALSFGATQTNDIVIRSITFG